MYQNNCLAPSNLSSYITVTLQLPFGEKIRLANQVIEMSRSHSKLDDQDETVEFDAIYLGKFLVHSFGQLFRAYHI